MTNDTFDSVPKETSPILVTGFQGNELENIRKITFASLSKNGEEKEKENKEKNNCKAFCVTRMRNNCSSEFIPVPL